MIYYGVHLMIFARSIAETDLVKIGEEVTPQEIEEEYIAVF